MIIPMIFSIEGISANIIIPKIAADVGSAPPHNIETFPASTRAIASVKRRYGNTEFIIECIIARTELFIGFAIINELNALQSLNGIKTIAIKRKL